MSHFGNEELRENLFSQAMDQVETDHPEINDPYDKEQKAAEIAQELFDNEMYFSYSHPSLSAAERNPGLANY